MGILLLILATIGIGIWIGIKISTYHIAKEHQVVYNQLHLLERFSNHWSEVSNDRTKLTSQLSHEQVTHVQSTMQTVIHLLQTVQRDQLTTANQNEHQAINALIKQAQQIGPSSEFEV